MDRLKIFLEKVNLTVRRVKSVSNKAGRRVKKSVGCFAKVKDSDKAKALGVPVS